MKKKQVLLLLLIFSVCNVTSSPLVQSIDNKTQVGYEIVAHSDTSSCSMKNLKKRVDARHVFESSFLLEAGKPCLVLRPIYYYDASTKQNFSLVNEQNNFDDQKIYAAYQAWKHEKKRKKFAHAKEWFDKWVGADIEIKPHALEILGYMIHLSSVKACNSVTQSSSWLSFSQGVFSRLDLNLQLIQDDKKGIIPKLVTTVGHGGICIDGSIERL